MNLAFELAGIVTVFAFPCWAILYLRHRRRPGYPLFWATAMMASSTWSGLGIAAGACAKQGFPTFLVGDGAGFIVLFYFVPVWAFVAALAFARPVPPPSYELRVWLGALILGAGTSTVYALRSTQPWRESWDLREDQLRKAMPQRVGGRLVKFQPYDDASWEYLLRYDVHDLTELRIHAPPQIEVLERVFSNNPGLHEVTCYALRREYWPLLARLPRLQKLILDEKSKLDGIGIGALRQASELQELSITSPQALSENEQRELGSLEQLRQLSFYNSTQNAPVSSWQSFLESNRLTAMESLSLRDDGFDGRGIAGLASCPRLKMVILNLGRITPQVAGEFRRLTHIATLYVNVHYKPGDVETLRLLPPKVSIGVTTDAELNESALADLAQLPNLKSVSIPRFVRAGKQSIAAFQEVRPDVRVEHFEARRR